MAELGGTMRSTMGRESRAQEAIRMKDEQLKVLTDQNSQLLRALDAMEEEANRIQTGKLATEEENRKLRDQNFELRNKARAAETQAKKALSEMADKDSQLKIMTDQNSELLRLLETEEAQTAQLQRVNADLRDELETLKTKYSNLLNTAKEHEQMAAKAAREGQLRAEELRILRAEAEQLRAQNADMKRKAQVELEALQEQLRVRKEKQYQLLEQVQSANEEKRQALDQSAAMEEKLRKIHTNHTELQTQLQMEARSKRNQELSNRELLVHQENLENSVRQLQDKIGATEDERLRMEAEARDSGEQLREMAEKVFQLLERLKLAELGKTKSVEALKKKEQEVASLKKKNQRLLRESTEEGKKRVRAELDKRVVMDQLTALKRHNKQLSTRCREEVKAKLNEHELRKQKEEKLQTLGGRLNFLLNKMQVDEESKIVNKEDMKKMGAQVRALREKETELTKKLTATGESNRIITQAMRLKQEELENLLTQYDALHDKLEEVHEQHQQEQAADEAALNSNAHLMTTDQVLDKGGRGRFYLEHSPTNGLIVIRSRTPESEGLIKRLGITEYLKTAQKSVRFRELVVDKVAQLMGLIVAGEEIQAELRGDIDTNNETIDHLSRKTKHMADRLDEEEDAKRRTLLQYVSTVKNMAAAEAERGGDGQVLQLTDSGIGDEEVHALAALLRGENNITELILRNNGITNDGARALGAVLSAPCGLRSVDLRENKVGEIGIRSLAEALERSSRVRHVYVHAGGKIEALGTMDNSQHNDEAKQPMMKVSTVCVVDIRKNKPEDDTPVLTDLPPRQTHSPKQNPNRFGGLSTSLQSQSSNNGTPQTPSSHSPTRRGLTKKSIQKRMKKLADNRKQRQQESSWTGYSGGRSAAGRGSRKFPPIHKRKGTAVQRSKTAPHPTRSSPPTYVDQARAAVSAVLPNRTAPRAKTRQRKKKQNRGKFMQRLNASPLQRFVGGKMKSQKRTQDVSRIATM